MKNLIIIISVLLLHINSLNGQILNEVACRPADSSCTISILVKQQYDIYCEYGTVSGSYQFTTPVSPVLADVPAEFILSKLLPDTKYFYRTRYRIPGSAQQYSSGVEHSVRTQRAKGKTFTFLIESDPHPYDKKGSWTLWKRTFQNQLADSADFLLDLGDTFGDDHNPLTITSDELKQLHLDCRSLFGTACHSLPLLFCLGNHEGESGYYLQLTPPNNLGVNGTLWRKYYYPNPIPGGIYSGNTASESYGIGQPQNYYAWEWGDALFVVLDVYRYAATSASPGLWDWTIGDAQYQWFRETLVKSKAKYKFVFAHHVRGWGRGAALLTKFFEWGGYENNGTVVGFTSKRPGWELPIHQLMVKYGVNVFFQGHDHLYAKEVVDGLIYQEVPMPSDSTYIIGMRDNGDAYTDVKLDGSGHIRVKVAQENATVEFVRSWLPADETAVRKNGEVAYSYTVIPTATSVRSDKTVPQTPVLEQNYPNPFNPSTIIRYRVQESGPVSLKVYNIMGQSVAVLYEGWRDTGKYSETFSGAQLPGGVYFYRLTVQGNTFTQKALLLK